MLYSGTDNVIDFGAQETAEGNLVFGAVYDSDRKMIYITTVENLDGLAQMIVPKKIYDVMEAAKLFILDKDSIVPVQIAVEKRKASPDSIQN